MIRATILVSGDPQSLGRGAEEVKIAIEAELSFYGLENEIEVGFGGGMTRTDMLPTVSIYPEGVVYGPVKPPDGALIVE